ncbi:MAG TPA: response regulator [Chloroflexota bacterium]|nr:response regulator [Chloroflexota bacterium]
MTKQSEAGRRSRVLVVDDDADVRYVVRWALEDRGFAVDTAANGRDAMTWLEDKRPDLLLLDLTMPIMGGSHVADLLHRRYQNVPILLITADGHAPSKAAAVGAYDYLQKPFELEDLVRAVEQGFSSASEQIGAP